MKLVKIKLKNIISRYDTKHTLSSVPLKEKDYDWKDLENSLRKHGYDKTISTIIVYKSFWQKNKYITHDGNHRIGLLKQIDKEKKVEGLSSNDIVVYDCGLRAAIVLPIFQYCFLISKILLRIISLGTLKLWKRGQHKQPWFEKLYSWINNVLIYQKINKERK